MLHVKALLLSSVLLALAEASLVFQAFEPFVPCADGSPAGIFSNVHEGHTNSQQLDQTKHIIVFEGGGACTDPEDCLEEAITEPYKFSSTLLPRTIEGTTILSEDPQEENPFQSYAKWFVPYCTQDLFLGDLQKGVVGEFTHGGSDIFRSAIAHWKSSVTGQHHGSVSQLVVLGISAGSIGLMNHVEDVQEAAQLVGVGKLQYILDAPSISDRWHEKNFSRTMETYVNLTEHPLCDVSNKYSRHYKPTITDLPCCLSSHCMFRHDENIRSIGSPKESKGSVMTEEILLLDADYDPLALAASSEKSDQKRFIDVMSNVWEGAETAGSRGTRALETSLWLPDSQDESLGPKGSWYISSCVAHGFFVPSVQIQHSRCLHGDFSDRDFVVRCRSDGAGVQSTIGQVDLQVTLWQTTDTWNLAKVQGTSIRTIVSDFVLVSQHNEGQHRTESSDQALLVFADDCKGPNCASTVGHPNECQTLFELEETFKPVPLGFKIAWYVFIALIIATAAARLPLQAMCTTNASNGTKEVVGTNQEESQAEMDEGKSECNAAQEIFIACTNICSVKNLSVVTAEKGFKVLQDVHLQINSSSVIGLLGRSGSGKSTLLSALSRQKLRSLRVSGGQIEMQCPDGDVAFLRQSDSVQMENMTASSFLETTASIYGADNKRVDDCAEMVKKLYCRVEQSGLNPFTDTKIKNLSGGQRRILAIATTLLLTPQLVLLDEPLSGLDDASSLQVMEFVQFLSNKYSCAVILSLHNPSEEVLQYLDRVVVMDNGYVRMQRDCTANRAFATDFRRELGSMMAGFLEDSSGSNTSKDKLKTVSMTGKDSMVENPGPRSTMDLNTTIDFDTTDETEREQEISVSTAWEENPVACFSTTPFAASTEEEGTNKKPKSSTWTMENSCYGRFLSFFGKTSFLCRRLHANYGSEPGDLLTLPIILMLFAMVLRFDGGSPVQEVLVSTFYIGIPVNLFRHKIHLSCKMWSAHRVEMDDQRISLLSYQLATQTFSFAAPLLSLIVAHILGYAVLGWSFESLAVQILFSAVHLLVALQLGRTICAYFHGDYHKFTRIYSVLIFLCFLFGGLLVPSRQLPPWLSWMYVFSFTFWAISGGALNILQYHGSEEYCVDALSCIATDGSFIARYTGFAPVSTEHLALLVLTIWFVALAVVEYLLLCHRCSASASSVTSEGTNTKTVSSRIKSNLKTETTASLSRQEEITSKRPGRKGSASNNRLDGRDLLRTITP
ncbi:ATP-binding protein [Seminavis robusta]|uniref:ATP-binding protein n=1 Tax=Seminavis robusta TaxID=568900 RepID=A0A9N8ETD5_9STRA|nr:ATP-binding protein [Seminavis robusta]|eukprot:Sro1640_g287940.1 ATP-binding protein (1237) ;mRNA; f:15514-19224